MSQLQNIQLHRDDAIGNNESLKFERNRDVIHVLEADLNRPLAGAMEILDETQRARADRFVFEKDRKRFVASHALTRQFIANCLECEPASVEFDTDFNGKPFLVNAPDDMRFNISHTSDRAMIAIAWGQEVGIDIEKHRPLNVMELAQRFFAPGEVLDLVSAPPREQLSAFFRCWTRKEAFVKALGKGLFLPLDQFRVSFLNSDSNPLLLDCEFDRTLVEKVRIVDLPVPDGYSAALAAGADPWTVVKWRVDH